MSKAIYAGTFGPFHRGHLDIVWKASTIFNDLYVVVARNDDKPASHTSVEAIEKDLKSYTVSNTKVIELPSNKLLVDLAKELDVKFLIRGLRGPKDFMQELEMADINFDLSNDDISTVFLISDPMYRHYSSSLVRSLVGKEGYENILEGFMPEHSAEEFIKQNRSY